MTVKDKDTKGELDRIRWGIKHVRVSLSAEIYTDAHLVFHSLHSHTPYYHILHSHTLPSHPSTLYDSLFLSIQWKVNHTDTGCALKKNNDMIIDRRKLIICEMI